MATASPRPPHKYQLLYFDAAGRAEIIRICLTLAKVDWTEERIPYKEWATRKATMPLGSVPVLMIDNVAHVQSVALARYTGRLAGWYPMANDDDAVSCLVIDEVCESLNELIGKAPKSGDPRELYKLRTAFQNDTMTKYASWLEGKIQANGGVGFTPGSKPNIADLTLYMTVDSVSRGVWDHIEMSFFQNYPGIMATVQRIQDHPDIKAYLNAGQQKKV
jgi:glutathione S-transferase